MQHTVYRMNKRNANELKKEEILCNHGMGYGVNKNNS